MSLGEIQPPFGTTKDSITLDDYLAKYNSSPVEELNFLAPRKTITGKFVPDKKENETMNLGTQEQRTEGMKKQAQELIEQAYHRGYKAGMEAGFDEWKKNLDVNQLTEQGRNEAWKVARTIIDFWFNVAHCDPNNFAKLFGIDAHLGDDVFEKFFEQFSASELIEKLHVYEEDKKHEKDSEIHVGDEVVLSDGTKLIVLSFSKDRETFDGIYVDGSGADILLDKSRVNKTGRHFPEIEEVLKKMQEDER